MAEATEEISPPIAPPNLEQMVLTQVQQWLGQCQSFRLWYRQNFLHRKPTEQEQNLADEIQPWLIRITRALLSQVLDPQFPHRHLARSVEATLWQLEEDWAARHNPMSDAEAEAVIGQFFRERAS